MVRLKRIGSKFLDVLAEEVLVGDGAMGTELYARGVDAQANFDELNIKRPELVKSVHGDYVAAGARFLETNTYGANRGRLAWYGLEDYIVDINAAGVRIAREAADGRAFVAGSIGSLPSGESGDEPIRFSDDDLYEIFREQAILLADAGVDAILLETFSDLEQLHIAVRAVKNHVDLPLVAELTFQHRAVTTGGVDVYSALQSLVEHGADVVGTNCGRGVANVLHIIEEFGARSPALISAFPNAGFPEDVGGRIMYLSSPQYLAVMGERMVQAGANLIGGCCGTTPISIRAMVEHIGRRRPVVRRIREVPKSVVLETPVRPPHQPASYLERMKDRKVVVVELDPPFGLDFERILVGSRVLQPLGVDAITLGDSPLSTLRVSNITTAAMIQKEVGIECIIHLCCRDHNIIGLQGLLMGAWMQGIKSVLAVTGDPAKLGNQPGASSVYDLNSIGLIKMIDGLNRGVNYAGASIRKATDFTIGCGFNPNLRNLSFEVNKLKRKVDAGARFILTQIQFDPVRLAEAVRMIRDLGIDAPIFPAIYAFPSARNAEFVHNELPGVTVPERYLARMAKTDRSTGQVEGMQIAREIIEECWEFADGFYILPPFNRYRVAAELVEFVRAHSGVAATVATSS